MPGASEKRVDILVRVKSGESVRSTASALGLPLSTTYYYAREHCRKQSQMEIAGLNPKERGYLIGMIVGDGSLIRHKGRGEFLAKIALDEKRDADIFVFLRSLFEKTGKMVNVRYERHMRILRIWSKSFYAYVLGFVQLKKEPHLHHNQKILLDIEHWSRELAIGFIGGLIDSDGHIKKNGSGGHYGATIATSQERLMEQVRELCQSHQIRTSCQVDLRAKRPRYSIHLFSKDLRVLCPEILCVKHERFHGGPGRT